VITDFGDVELSDTMFREGRAGFVKGKENKVFVQINDVSLITMTCKSPQNCDLVHPPEVWLKTE
jgi:hypothetical protein